MSSFAGLSPFESSRTLLSVNPNVEGIIKEEALGGNEKTASNAAASAATRKKLILPDSKDVNKMLNFDTDNDTDIETDAESIFSRQVSRNDELADFDDEDDVDGDLEEKDPDGLSRSDGAGKKGVARGTFNMIWLCFLH